MVEPLPVSHGDMAASWLEAWELAADGRLRIDVGETFRLVDATPAHERVESSDAAGKLVLCV